MAFFRGFLLSVFCACISLPAWADGQSCGPALAGKIMQYRSGDVNQFLKYDCVIDNQKWKIQETPLEWAIGGYNNIQDNYTAVKAFLDAKPELANSVDYDHQHVTMLAQAVRSCCNDEDAVNKPKIVKELLEHGAEVNAVLDNIKNDHGTISHVIVIDESKRKVTALDVVRAYIESANKNGTACKAYGIKHCTEIEQILLDHGAKTYAELNGEVTSSNQLVVHQDTPEVINTTASVPPATKSRTVEIGGIILDYKTGEPVPYANIVLVNPDGSTISNAGCSTDMDGKFSGKFNNVPTNAMMRVSVVGYQTLTLSPSSNAQIKLQPTATALQEVSIVATICDDEILKKLNARKGEEAVDANGKTFCKPTECVNDLYELRDGVCVDKYAEEELEDCTLAELENLHASSGEKPVGGECVAMICANGYHFQEPEKVVCVPDESGTDNSQNDGTNGNDTETVTPPDNAEAIADAEKAYDAAHEKETSLANRLLGGASMAATGIGGMQLAQGLAEQSADKAAEADMQAYLATFTCKIGDAGGKSYKGGEMGIEVSGGNQLTSLYQQYVDLAADLKERKNALGMAPGIESTVVMDKANMGIYDAEAGNGIENGTYASLYRASKGNDADKQKLSDQKDTSGNRVKYGAIAAGVGAVGGAIGNAIINSGDDDDDDIDLSKNGLDNFGYNLDGTCVRGKNESVAVTNNKCDSLTKRGTWWTSFSYGTVYGDAKCGTKAESPDKKQIPCSCKVTAVGDKKIDKAEWVYFASMNNDAGCKHACATRCASSVSGNESLRKKVLDSVDKKDSKLGAGLAGLGASLGSSLGSSVNIGNVASMASGLMSGSGQ